MRWILVIACLVSGWAAAGLAAGNAQPLRIYAAASLPKSLEEIDGLWIHSGHPAPVLTIASSKSLAERLRQGAPADLFLSSEGRLMDGLGKAGLLLPRSRVDIVTSTLVLVLPVQRTENVDLRPGVSLTAILGPQGLLAVGKVATSPVGIHAAQALKWLGIWDDASQRLLERTDTHAVLLALAHGKAAAGIVYRSDVSGDADVRIAGTFPQASVGPLPYPAAVLAGSGQQREAAAYLALLRSPPAQAIFRTYGFTPIAAVSQIP